jgi:hypothetical protein
MPGQRCLNGNLRRFQIACLAHHDTIRVLPQERTQDPRKRQADGFVHGYLHNSFQIVFDRFFRGQQLRIDGVDLAQTRIKRGRLARTGRPGRDKDAVWAMDDLEKIIEDVIRHAQRFEIEIHNAAIEHAEHEALAKLCWQS